MDVTPLANVTEPMRAWTLVELDRSEQREVAVLSLGSRCDEDLDQPEALRLRVSRWNEGNACARSGDLEPASKEERDSTLRGDRVFEIHLEEPRDVREVGTFLSWRSR